MSLKSILTTTSGAAALLVCAPAHADNYYLSVFGGWSSPDADFSVNSLTRANTSPAATGTDSRVLANGLLALGDGGGYFPYFIRANGPFSEYERTSFYYTWLTTAQGFTDAVDDGFVVGAALGMDFQDGWRAEIEGAYRSYDFEGGARALTATQLLNSNNIVYTRITGEVRFYTTFPGTAVKTVTYTSGNPYTRAGSLHYSRINSATFTLTAATAGDVNAFSIMANLWYDFDLGESTPLTPFIGVGAGMARLEAEYSIRATYPTNTLAWFPLYGSTYTSNSSADDWVFAWQVGAGLAYEFGGGMSLSAQYRYFSTGDVSLATQDISVDAHEVLIGFSIPLGN